jgi:integrase
VLGSSASTPFTPTAIYKRARRAWRDAGLPPIGLHEARHSCASMWIAAGVNIKAVSQYLGHASISITLDRYGHLLPGSDDEARRLVAAYLERADTASRLRQLSEGA